MKTDSAFYQLFKNPWLVWVGYRYLKSKKSSKFLSFITVLSILGVGLGVTAMIVVLSVMDGFETQLKAKLFSSKLHVLITPTSKVPEFSRGFVPESALRDVPGVPGVEETLKKLPEVKNVWPIIGTEAILRSRRKVNGVVVKGISKERLEAMKPQVVESAEPALLTEGQGPEARRLPGLWIGQEMAFMMGLIPGDVLTLISPTETQGPLGNIPRMKKFVLEGIYHSGLPEQELHIVFTEDRWVQSFLRKRGVVSSWEIETHRFEQAEIVSGVLRKKLKNFRVQDWRELNSTLFASLRLERLAMFVVLAVIILVASFNIITTLTMMVLEKKKEISILKAMGTRRSQVGAIFLAEGILIGAIGVLGGVFAAGFICTLLKRYEFIQLPEFYYDRTLPVTFEPVYYVAVTVCATAIVLLACLYPSRRAASLSPMEGIRLG